MNDMPYHWGSPFAPDCPPQTLEEFEQRYGPFWDEEDAGEGDG